MCNPWDVWLLADAHAKLAANYIAGYYQLPSNCDISTKSDINRIKVQFVDTPRHNMGVDFYDHSARLEKELQANAPVWNQQKVGCGQSHIPP
ncbi:MAG: hypothetical protein GY816_05970 [Cytophagales bacterium]|nr:hypothetical protein [Cytophagales bacterium]